MPALSCLPAALRALLAAAALAALTAAQASQQHLFTFQASKDGDALGWAVACGDLDKDGFAEVLLGAPWADDRSRDAGRVQVVTGWHGGVRLTVTGEAADDWFGASVAVAGDVDGDGHLDLVVGAPQPQATAGAGYARVLSGKDGKALWTWRGAAAGDRFGSAVAGIGDVDRDGFADVAVAAPLADAAGADAGLVRVLSGRTGQTLWQRVGPAAGDALGWSLAAVGDADGDGWLDLAAGSRRAGAVPGFALLVSGRDGSNLFRFDGTVADDRFGVCVAAAGDTNRDGRPDVAVLAARGQVRVHSGRDGTQLRAWSEPPRAEAASTCMAGVGDIDGDGHDDVAVGTPLGGFPISGVVRVWSGRDGSLLQMLLGTATGLDHGWSVAGGDVNGDGRPDVVMSEPRSIATGGGQVQVLSGTPLFLSADRHELSLSAASGPRQQTWTLDAGPSRAGAFYLAIGTVSGPKPGVLLPGGIHVPINPDPWTDLTLIFPNGPMLVASIGMLDAKGQGAGAFRLVNGLPSWLAGTVFWHAYLVFAPGRWLAASNAVPVTLLR